MSALATMACDDQPAFVAPDPVEMSISNWDAPDYTAIMAERMRRLQNLRDADDPGTAWKALRLLYKDDPVKFINDWGMTTDPRNPEIGLPTTVPFILFKRQVEFIEWIHARWKAREDGIVEKSRDMGCSWLCVAFACWMVIFHPGTVVGVGSRKEDYVDKLGDPKSLLWKVRKFIGMLPAELRPHGCTWNESKHAPSMRVMCEQESAIIGEAGDNIGRGARTSLYLVDEAAHLLHPESTDAALSATSNCKIHVSSVNGPGNPFYKKRHGGEFPVFIFDWRQDPRKNEEWYAKQVRTLDPSVLAQEIDRNYESSIHNAFIPGDVVRAAMQRGPAEVRANGGLRVGIDVARYGDDKTAIVFRRGRVMLKKVMMTKASVTDVAGRARAEINAYGMRPEQIAVDVIGIGAGVADIMRGYYPDTRSRDGTITQIVQDVSAGARMSDGKHYNLRAFMWSEMREWLKTAAIPNDQDLATDLSALRYGFKNGELLLESKGDAKARGVKSPDIGDALALTLAVPTYVPPEPMRANVLLYKPSDSSIGM